jgi:hypothetical protein
MSTWKTIRPARETTVVTPSGPPATGSVPAALPSVRQRVGRKISSPGGTAVK